MRSILIAMVAQCLVLAMAGVTSAQDAGENPLVSRDAAVAEGVRALSEDVRKLSDDVKELVALLKSQQNIPPTESKSPTSSEPSPAKIPIHSSGATMSPSRLNDQLLKLNGSEVPDQQLVLDVAFRDLSLVEAKTIAMKTYRESRSGKENANDELERIKDEQNLLKSVEDKYWDLWAAFKAFDARKREVEGILYCWRFASNAQRVEDAKMSDSLARLWEHSRIALYASLNGSEAAPRTRGLRQMELILRETLGLNVDDTMLRPTDMPNLNSTQFDWVELNKIALNENIWLKRKRREMETLPEGMPKAKLEREIHEHELMLCLEFKSCYRLFDWSSASLKLNLERWEANEQEIKIYQTRLKDKVGDQNVLLENIARAHQRRAQAEIQHHQAASHYNKALANTKYLCSQLTVGTD